MNIIEKLSDLYNINPALIKKISDGYQNTVFEYENFIFRITHLNRRSISELQSELNYISRLAQAGISVAEPILLRYGNIIGEINDHFVISFQKAPGKPVDVTDNNVWDAEFFFNWGQFVGKMHRIANDCNDFDRPVWTVENPDILNLLPKIKSDTIKQQYLKTLEQLKGYQKDAALFGLIHNDFHQGNFFEHKGTITVFDFDDCAYHWKAYDLAVSFYHAHWQTSSFTPKDTQFSQTFWSNFLKGYREEHPVLKEMLEQIPIFLKIREIFLYVLFLEKWDHKHLEDWQSYTLANLKKKIEESITYPINLMEY